MALTVFYGIAVLAILQGLISLLQGCRSARHIRTYRPSLDESMWQPRVVVFCPCKGLDSGFRENVLSIRDQDYPHLRVVFIVEAESDPAFPVLHSEGMNVCVAGETERRGQKVHNLIHAVEHEAGDAEVFVFCDADARFPHNWVRSLVAPLQDESVGVASGYRWYAAESGSLPALLRSSWNASAVTLLGDHGRNFAWGGSMALRRSVFERIGVRQAWDGAVSDDYAVTRAVRAAGLRIVFVPRALAPSYGDCRWGELLEFTTRQIIITRVYDPGMWRLALVSQSVFNLAFWTGLWLDGAALAVPLVLYVLAGIKSYVRHDAVASVLSGRALSKQRWSYILLAPLTALLFEYNLVLSAFTRKITWRQKHYTLLSPDRTVVRRGGAES